MRRRQYCVGFTSCIATALAGCTGDADIEQSFSQRAELTFEANADENIIIEVENSGFGEAVIDLTSPSGRLILRESIRSRRELTVTAPSDGEYRLHVDPRADEATVKLTVDDRGLVSVNA